MVRDIDGINGPRSNATQAGNSKKGKAIDAANSSATSASAAQDADDSKDTVEISDRARVLKSLEVKIASIPDVNIDRVAEIKAAIESGEYNIDAGSIASKIILSEGEVD